MAEDINILIVEDRKEDADVLEKILSGQGWRVWVAASADEALKLVKESYFACVLCELHIPGYSGREITRAILKARPATSVVVMTVYSFISSAIEAMEEGAYGYVSKPFYPAEIKIVVRRAIERFMFLSSDKEKEHFAELSVKDGLTGVYNRRFLKEYFTEKIAAMRRISDRFGLLMIDIDHFKQYNDTNGHPAGDELLKQVAQLFQQAVRHGDVVFRYGGEEFVIFLDHTDKKGALLVAERIRNSVGLFVPTTVSIGVAAFPDDGGDYDTLISKADAALYNAKETGRNKVCTVGE